MILGVLVFGDVIRVSPGMIALQLAGIAALVMGSSWWLAPRP